MNGYEKSAWTDEHTDLIPLFPMKFIFRWGDDNLWDGKPNGKPDKISRHQISNEYMFGGLKVIVLDKYIKHNKLCR